MIVIIASHMKVLTMFRICINFSTLRVPRRDLKQHLKHNYAHVPHIRSLSVLDILNGKIIAIGVLG